MHKKPMAEQYREDDCAECGAECSVCGVALSTDNQAHGVSMNLFQSSEQVQGKKTDDSKSTDGESMTSDNESTDSDDEHAHDEAYEAFAAMPQMYSPFAAACTQGVVSVNPTPMYANSYQPQDFYSTVTPGQPVLYYIVNQ